MADWDEYISNLRDKEYPMLKGKTYLDHAGMTPPPKRLIERFAMDQINNLFGNPHSGSPPSQLSTRRCEDVRLGLLRFFNADPKYFDIVFVANATAGIKLVAEALRDGPCGFWYGYHRDSHTSLVGVREAASAGHKCFASEEEFESAIRSEETNSASTKLFAFPAQSNLTGRKLPLHWCRIIRDANERSEICRFSLLDAAALVSTSPLDLGEPDSAPDFTVLSLYKIFGFPDLGALIVRKDSADALRQKRYFGGGTVSVASCFQEQWHLKKETSIHDALEDGTLPIHNIMALGIALETHLEMFESMDQISKHTHRLANRLHQGLAKLRHGNGKQLCRFYFGGNLASFQDSARQGPILAFTMMNSQGAWISNTEVEKLSSIRNIHLRTGGMCNPGGIAAHLDLAARELRDNFSAGYRCGSEDDSMVGGKPNGVIRVSLGATNTTADVELFVDFVREFFVESISSIHSIPPLPVWNTMGGNFIVENLTIFPIKSCAGWKVPAGVKWEVRREGLAWDREWCLVHKGTGKALSQKRNPKMALIKPALNVGEGTLTVRFDGEWSSNGERQITIPLSHDPSCHASPLEMVKNSQRTLVCGDEVFAKAYNSPALSRFFSTALDVPCQLVRYPAQGPGTLQRQCKASHFPPHQQVETMTSDETTSNQPLLLANESPILIISRPSVNRLNEQIKETGGTAVTADSFRANIIIAQDMNSQPGTEQPYAEDEWPAVRIGQQFYQLLGACRRCQMVCVDQDTAEKKEEPFVTLAKTRRFGSRVLFGQHARHVSLSEEIASPEGQWPTITLGERVQPLTDYESEQMLQRAVR